MNASWFNGDDNRDELDPRDEPDDDYEPEDPDGEAFRGGERAAYERDEMDRIQSELK